MTSIEDQERRLITMYTTQYNQLNTQIVQTDRRIERMYDSLDEIRSKINRIVSLRNERVERTANLAVRNALDPLLTSAATASATSASATATSASATSAATNFRRAPNNNYHREYVHYDYTDPINPNTYLEPRTNTSPLRTSTLRTNAITDLLSTFLASTVPIRPTAEQIDAATTLICYSDIVDPIASNCAISLEPFLPTDMVRQINHCKHLFLPDQFRQWFQNNVRCPVCRHDLRTGTNTNHLEDDSELAQSALTDLLVQTIMQPYTNRRASDTADTNADILLFEAIITPNDT
jgi:hypothetical protein